MLYNKNIFITGGAGFLGHHLVEKYHKDNHLTVYSRDEAKHYYMQRTYPNVNFVLGDVRNYDLMRRAAKNHNVGIFAASMKQIDACTFNAEEANQTIVHGAFNSRRIAEENGFDSACFISTDKSRAPTTIYGAMKFIAGESFILAPELLGANLSTVIYGNVANSTGSIIPVLWKCIREDSSATLFHPDMTRFYIELDEASELIENALDYNGVNIIPKLRSYRLLDLFNIYKEKFDLKFDVGNAVRHGEKLHEIMYTEEEAQRAHLVKTPTGFEFFVMTPDNVFLNTKAAPEEYSSKNQLMSKDELQSVLSKRNYFK